MTEQETKDIIASASTWREAAFKLIEALTNANESYSSGEIARHLRLHSGYKFSALSVGAFIQQQFLDDMLPLYNDGDHSNSAPVQYSRICEGRFPDRTPAGQLVFVYGLDLDACDEHDFEVCIPLLGKTAADDPKPAVISIKPLHPAKAVQDVVAKGQTPTPTPLTSTRHKITVYNCGRLCIPRSVFEDALHQGGNAFRAGDPVWIHAEGTTAYVTLVETGKDAEHRLSLTKDKGRVRFFCPLPGKSFISGDVYVAKIESNGSISVDLSSL